MANCFQKAKHNKALSAVLIIFLTVVYLLSTAAYSQDSIKDGENGFFSSDFSYTVDSLSFGDVWAFNEATYNASKYKGPTGSYNFYNSKENNSTSTTSQDVAFWNPIKFNDHDAVTGTKVETIPFASFFVNNTKGTLPSPADKNSTITTMTTNSTGTYTVIPNSTGTYRVYVYSENSAPATGALKYFKIDSVINNNAFASGTAIFTEGTFEQVGTSKWYYVELSIDPLGWGAYQPGCSGEAGKNSATSDSIPVIPEISFNTTLGESSYNQNIWSVTPVKFNTLLVLQWDSSIELGPISKVGSTLTIDADSVDDDAYSGTVTVTNIFGETITVDGTAQAVAQAPLIITTTAGKDSVFTGADGAELTETAPGSGVYRYNFEQTATLSFSWGQAVTYPSVSLSGNNASGKINFLAQKMISASYTIGAVADFTLTADFTGAEDNKITYSVYIGGKPESGGVLSASGELTSATPSATIKPAMDNIYIRLVPADSASGTIPVGEINITALSDPSLPLVAHNIKSDRKYAYIEDALLEAVSGDTIVLLANASFRTEAEGQKLAWKNNSAGYTVKAGVTLLLPYAEGATTIMSSTGDNSFEHANTAFMTSVGNLNPSTGLNYTLTIPADITVSVGASGRIVVGGRVGASEGGSSMNGATSGSHANLVVNGTLELGSNSILSVTGYLLGTGTVKTIGTGATIYQPYVIMDWRGAGVTPLYLKTDLNALVTMQSGETQVSPFSHWGFTNIRSNTEITTGNYMKLYGTLPQDGTFYCSIPVLIGDSNQNGLLRLGTDGKVESSYEAISSNSTWANGFGFPGKIKVTLSGETSMGSMSMDIDLSAGSLSVNTVNYTLQIPYVFDFVLKNGTHSINNSFALLPGARIEVQKDAHLIIGTGTAKTRVMIFDGLTNLQRWGNSSLLRDDSSVNITDITTDRNHEFNYPGTKELKNAGYSGDAELIVDGALTLGSRVSFGGLIQTNGGGTVIAQSGMTDRATVQVGAVGKGFVNLYYRYLGGMSLHSQAARLINCATGQEMTITAGTTYYGYKLTGLKDADYTYMLYPNSGDVADCSEQNVALDEDIVGGWCTKQHNTDTLIYIAAKTPTCSEEGNNAYYQCSACGKCYVENSDGALTETTEAEQKLSTVSHTGGSHTAAVAAGCLTAGNVEYWTCSACGWNFSDADCTNKLDTVEVPATGHAYANPVVTFGEDPGTYTVTLTCGQCPDGTAGHAVTSETRNSTVTSDAGDCQNNSSMTYTASGNFQGVAYSDTKVITGDKGAHNYESVVTAPTCTAGGYTTHTCKICGATYTSDATAATGHSYGEGVQTTAPTCEAPGVMTFTCNTCGATRTEEIAANGHSYDAGVETTPATCTEEGTKTFTCATCANTYTEAIPALGHVDSDNNYRCDKCGLICFYATNINLGNDLDILFAIRADSVNDTQKGKLKAVFTHTYADSRAPNVVEVPYIEVNIRGEQGETVPCYAFVYSGIAAKEMCDEITVEIVEVSGDKRTVVSELKKDSIRSYAGRLLNNYSGDTYATLRTLLVDMLNYGAACQNSFGYNPGDPANKDLTDEQKVIGEGSLTDTSNTGPILSRNLVVKSNIEFHVQLQSDVVAPNGEIQKVWVAFTNHRNREIGYEAEVKTETVQDENGATVTVYTIAVKGLVPADLNQPIEITIGTESTKATTSIASYLRDNLNKDAAFPAFAKFATSAYNYLHKTT